MYDKHDTVAYRWRCDYPGCEAHYMRHTPYEQTDWWRELTDEKWAIVPLNRDRWVKMDPTDENLHFCPEHAEHVAPLVSLVLAAVDAQLTSGEELKFTEIPEDGR